MKVGRKLTDIYVDADACPVREEIYRVAARLQLNVFVVSNGSRPIRPPQANIGNALVSRGIARRLRELGANTRGPLPITKGDRSRFLSALDTALEAALRESVRR